MEWYKEYLTFCKSLNIEVSILFFPGQRVVWVGSSYMPRQYCVICERGLWSNTKNCDLSLGSFISCVILDKLV